MLRFDSWLDLKFGALYLEKIKLQQIASRDWVKLLFYYVTLQ